MYIDNTLVRHFDPRPLQTTNENSLIRRKTFLYAIAEVITIENIGTLCPKSFSLAIAETITSREHNYFSFFLEGRSSGIGLMHAMQCECVGRNETDLIYLNYKDPYPKCPHNY